MTNSNSASGIAPSNAPSNAPDPTSDRTPSPFPAGFIWGAATSAYQVEGSPFADGALPSFWHRFSHTPGLTHEGDTGDVACDQYRRIGDDVRLMRELGLQSYRFSIAWGRVLPRGIGAPNAAGIAHYDRVVDLLLENGMIPNVTLYHWDLPAALDDRGGWLNPDCANWFADYARVMYRALGDRVPMWATLNEPWVVVDAGYLHGIHAPGHRNLFEAPIAAHNLMRAHGAAVQAYRAEASQSIGLVVNIEPKYAATGRDEDVTATARADAYMNRQYLDAALKGRYPPELADIFGDAWPHHSADDMKLIQQPLDWVGINYYTRSVTRNEPAAFPVRAARVPQPQNVHTEMDWEVYPPGLSDTLVWFRDSYGDTPIYVTENGSAFADPAAGDDDTIDDPLRVAYLRAHVRAVRTAIEAGVDVRGYYAWSLLDNFEWSAGYAKRFGIIAVDRATQRRTLKSSAREYAEIVRTHGASLTR
ncbi:MAG: GH1 family beta-glucosidase [Gemmatimonadota bacterium]|nr:GH1 family beta-glucosidase [Gemmatimonadota bacterium]